MDWTKTRATSYEYREVNRATWGDGLRLDRVLSMSITQDSGTLTRECAEMESVGDWSPAEQVVRAYMTAEQAGERVRTCMGTFVVRRSSCSHDGRKAPVKSALHSPLMPLEGAGDVKALAPVGYTVPAAANCAEAAAAICREHGIAPVIASRSPALLAQPYTAAPGMTWLGLASAVAAAGGMEVRTDAFGRVLVAPPPSGAAPAWTFADGDESIRMPDLRMALDLGSVPNVCEVVWSEGGRTIAARAVNDDPASPVSTEARGYEAVLRVENPEELQSGATQASAEVIAAKRLREASLVVAELSLKHAWCPVRVGDPVRLVGAGLSVDGVVSKMDIELDTVTTCSTTVAVEMKMWG